MVSRCESIQKAVQMRVHHVGCLGVPDTTSLDSLV